MRAAVRDDVVTQLLLELFDCAIEVSSSHLSDGQSILRRRAARRDAEPESTRLAVYRHDRQRSCYRVPVSAVCSYGISGLTGALRAGLTQPGLCYLL